MYSEANWLLTFSTNYLVWVHLYEFLPSAQTSFFGTSVVYIVILKG
jgi:hypothetical protein